VRTRHGAHCGKLANTLALLGDTRSNEVSGMANQVANIMTEYI
jgi:hypothetical protein